MAPGADGRYRAPMRVWLVNPPVLGSRPRRIQAVVDALFYNSPPLGLASVAAVLEAAGHEVRITDAPVERLSVPALLEHLGTPRPDVVGITSLTAFFDQACATALALKARQPHLPVVLGGPHVTARPELLLEHPEFDLAVLGEGEITFREVVDLLQAGKSAAEVPGTARVHEGALQVAPPRPLLDDLDALPLPARHLLPLARYRPLPNDQRDLPKTSVVVSRGCPFSCTFCEKRVFGDTWRSRSPARVVDEMHHLVERWGIRDIAFVDSTFTPSRRRLEAVLAEMEARPARTTWTASCRANLLDETLLRRMKAAGCWRIRIAIESGDDAILAAIRKGVTREQFAATVEAATRAGVEVKGFFMVGHIGETPATIERTIRFALSLPLTDVTVQVNTPLPGTTQWEACRRHGTLIDTDPRRATFFEPVFVPHGLTPEAILRAQQDFYRRFYLRPSHALARARRIRHLSDLTLYLRALPLAAALFSP